MEKEKNDHSDTRDKKYPLWTESRWVRHENKILAELGYAGTDYSHVHSNPDCFKQFNPAWDIHSDQYGLKLDQATTGYVQKKWEGLKQWLPQANHIPAPEVYISEERHESITQRLKDRNKFAHILLSRFMSLVPDDQRNAIVCHELGHILNGDLSNESIQKKINHSPNESAEYMAHYAGAIIYGNPRKYFEAELAYYAKQACTEGQKKFFNSDLTVDQLTEHMRSYCSDTSEYFSQPGNIYNFNTVQTTLHPATFFMLRRLRKWADRLESHGVTDNEGNITNYQDAFAMLKEQKEVTSSMGDTHSLAARQVRPNFQQKSWF